MRLRVETKVIVEGDGITIDVSGSEAEVPTGYNVPFEGSLLVGALLRGPHAPARRDHLPGARAPERRGLPAVKVVAPKGTIFNPNFPRACFSRFCQVQRVVDNTILALSDAAARAGHRGQLGRDPLLPYSGFLPSSGEYWLYLEVNEGSYGGRFGKDAMDSVDNLMANTRNNPIEELDLRFPMRCDQYELRPEPAAPGRWRGGVGIIRRNRFLVDGTYSCEGDRQYQEPRGIHGGWDGLTASTHKNPGTPQEEYLEAKVTGIEFKAGEFIEFREPNAGGYGDPLDRRPAMVREDVLDDFTTIDLAREAYGVIFVDEGDFEIDEEATKSRRDEIRASRNGDRDSLERLFSRAEGLLPSNSPTSEAGNSAFGMV